MRYFVGLDWASREHAVCVIDEQGRVLEQFTVEHSADGMAELSKRLRKRSTAGDMRVAIERPTGLIVDTLVEDGVAVVPIHPNVVKATRPRYSAAQGKTDLGDAYLLADVLRTDGHRFRVLTPLSDETKALRGRVRLRDELVAQRVVLANQLRSLLEQFWPGAAGLFAHIDSSISLAFLDRYPSPSAARSLGEKRMAAFMAQHSYSGRFSAAELVAKLRAAPIGVSGELEAEAKGQLSAPWSPFCSQWSHRCRRSPSPSSRRWKRIQTARSSPPSFGVDASAPRIFCPSWATTGLALPRPNTSLLRRALRLSPGSPASTVLSASAGHATSACVRRSPAWPTPLAGPRPGQPSSTAAPGTAAATIPMPAGLSPVPGAVCSGAAGRTAPPTTRASTQQLVPSSLASSSRRPRDAKEVDTGCLTSTAPSKLTTKSTLTSTFRRPASDRSSS